METEKDPGPDLGPYNWVWEDGLWWLINDHGVVYSFDPDSEDKEAKLVFQP